MRTSPRTSRTIRGQRKYALYTIRRIRIRQVATVREGLKGLGFARGPVSCPPGKAWTAQSPGCHLFFPFAPRSRIRIRSLQRGILVAGHHRPRLPRGLVTAPPSAWLCALGAGAVVRRMEDGGFGGGARKAGTYGMTMHCTFTFAALYDGAGMLAMASEKRHGRNRQTLG